MPHPDTILFCIAAAAFVALIVRFGRKRHDYLAEFERTFDTPAKVSFRTVGHADESEAVTRWKLEGVAGEFDFTFSVKETRGERNALSYSLSFTRGVVSRAGVYAFGGSSKDSRRDQARLAKLFARIWPDAPSLPDTRPPRLRAFLSRS